MKRGGAHHPRKVTRAKPRARPEPAATIPACLSAVKPRDYGSTKAVVLQAFDEAGGAKRVGAFYDLGPSSIYGFTDPEAKGNDLSLDRARRLTYLEGVKTFADDFAALAGGVFLSPAVTCQGEALAEIGGDLGKDVAEVVAELLRAVQDGQLTEAERRQLLERCDAVMATLIALRGRVMQGAIL